jgi:mutator protein MutT
LFAAMCVVWGVPYLLIKVAVDDGLSPFVVVAGRCLVGAALLLPFALRGRGFAALGGHWGPLLAYTVVELAGPWLLLTHAETRTSSSIAALLIAATPIVAAVATRTTGHEHLEPRRLVGLAVGVGGVAALVGIDLSHLDLFAVVEVLLTAVGYAVGPVIVSTRMRGVPPMPVIVASLGLTGLAYLPLAVAYRPRPFPAGALASVAALGVVCTALAFVVFFALIAEVGPARAPVITYVNPAVALLLGVLLLNEPFTLGIGLGFPLVVLGSVLATARSRARTVVVAAAVSRADGALLAARRSAPPELAGRWELPGGKVEPGEDDVTALARELLEELGVVVEVGERVGGDWPIRPGVVLRVYRGVIREGEPRPLEDHDALRWVTTDEWDTLAWLPADRPIVATLCEGSRSTA